MYSSEKKWASIYLTGLLYDQISSTQVMIWSVYDFTVSVCKHEDMNLNPWLPYIILAIPV